MKNISLSLYINYLFLSVIFLIFFNSPVYAKKTIAILPFDVLSKNPEYEQFGIGTMDTLSVALISIPDFVMINRSKLNSLMKEQSFQKSGFSDLNKSIEMGKLLGAEILITGTIQNFDNKFRITANFIEVKTGKIIQASKVTGANIFDLQDQLAEQLINLEDIKLTTDQRKEITNITKSTNNNLAFDFYTKGRTEYNKVLEILVSNKSATDLEELELLNKTLEYFNKAIETDPNYFLAIASKAQTQAILYSFLIQSKEYKNDSKAIEYLKQADENVELAYKISKNSGSIYKALAFVNYIKGADQQKTIDYSLKAIKYDPNDKEAYLWLSMSYYSTAYQAYNAKDYDKAIEANENTIKYIPSFTNAYYYLGLSYYAKKEINKAIINFERALSIVPNNQKVIGPLIKIYQEKADEYYKSSDFINLEKTYNSMLNYQDKNADLYNNLAIAYFMQKKYDLAQTSYEKAISLDSTKGNFYDNLALLYETKGDKEKADINYKKACELGNKVSCH